tara:strand:- start:88 stop:252 length:165 start_codon:yes stop_codon:yes gene_type:complete
MFVAALSKLFYVPYFASRSFKNALLFIDNMKQVFASTNCAEVHNSQKPFLNDRL